jgi:hypothetical protein
MQITNKGAGPKPDPKQPKGQPVNKPLVGTTIRGVIRPQILKKG